jgi:ABC-type transport system involved in multi-copper enzyme maturation permease subunit
MSSDMHIPPGGANTPQPESLSVRKPRVRSDIATILLALAAGFFNWFLLDWGDSFSLIHIPSQKAVYLSWLFMQIVFTVLFCSSILSLLKARLWWSRVVFPSTLLLLAAAVQAASIIIFASGMPDRSEDRLLWLGEWITPEVLTCMWGCVGITTLTAVFSVLIAVTLSRRDGTFADFKTIIRNWFRSLLVSPLSLFFGPIFIKDIRVAGRRTGTYWTRMVYPVALLGLISIIYFSMTAEHRYIPSNAERLDNLQQVAPSLAVGIGWFQFILLLVLAAALTASSVCDEKRTRTLSALMTTPMTSAQIIMGKLFSRMSQLLIIALISAPFLLGVRVFGGLDAEFVLAMTSITITSAIFMASLGVLFSIWFNKPASAAATAIFAFIGITVGPLLVLVLAMISSGPRRGGPPEELLVISAPMAMGMVTSMVFGAGPNVQLTQIWTINSGLNLLFAGITSLIAAGALRRVMLSDPAPAAARKPKRTRAAVRRSAAPTATSNSIQVGDAAAIVETGVMPDAEMASPVGLSAAPEEVFVERDREVWNQPVLWRELRQPSVGTRRTLIVTSLLALAGFLWLYSQVPPSTDEVHPIIMAIAIVVFCVSAAMSTTSSVTGEKDASTWTVLLTTPLKPLEILGAKVVGAIRKHWFLSSILAAHLLIGIIAGGIHPVILLHTALIFLSVAVLLAGTGVLMSLLVKRPLAAMLLNLLFAGGIWIGLPVLGAVVSELVMRGGNNDWMADIVMAMNPVFMAVTAATGDGIPQTNTGGASFRYHMASGTIGVWEFTGILFGTAIIGILIGVLALRLACSLFPRHSGRSS